MLSKKDRCVIFCFIFLRIICSEVNLTTLAQRLHDDEGQYSQLSSVFFGGSFSSITVKLIKGNTYRTWRAQQYYVIIFQFKHSRKLPWLWVVLGHQLLLADQDQLPKSTLLVVIVTPTIQFVTFLSCMSFYFWSVKKQVTTK